MVQAGPTCTFVLATRFEHKVFHDFLRWVWWQNMHVKIHLPHHQMPTPMLMRSLIATARMLAHALLLALIRRCFVTPAILEEARCSRGPLWLAKEVTAALSEDLLEMPDLETLAWVPAVRTKAEETSSQQEQQRSKFSHSSAAAMQQHDEGHYLSFLASDNAAITGWDTSLTPRSPLLWRMAVRQTTTRTAGLGGCGGLLAIGADTAAVGPEYFGDGSSAAALLSNNGADVDMEDEVA